MLRGKTGIHNNQQPDKSPKRTKSFYSSIPRSGSDVCLIFCNSLFLPLKSKLSIQAPP